MELLAQLLFRGLKQPIHFILAFVLKLGRYRLERAFLISCGDRVSRKKWAGILIEQAPHLRIDDSGRLKTVVLLVSLNCNPQIIAVHAVDLTR